jgi:hypothetical protein
LLGSNDRLGIFDTGISSIKGLDAQPRSSQIMKKSVLSHQPGIFASNGELFASRATYKTANLMTKEMLI